MSCCAPPWKSWPGDAVPKDHWQERQLSLRAGQLPCTAAVAGGCCWAAGRRRSGFSVWLCRWVGLHGHAQHPSLSWHCLPIQILSELQLLWLTNVGNLWRASAMGAAMDWPWCGAWGAPWLEDEFCWRNYNCPKPVMGCWVSNTLEEVNYKLWKLGDLCWRRGYS